jgi:hypothetical protein
MDESDHTYIKVTILAFVFERLKKITRNLSQDMRFPG